MIPRFFKKTPKIKRVRPVMANKNVIEKVATINIEEGYTEDDPIIQVKVIKPIEKIEFTASITGEGLEITPTSENETTVKKSKKKKQKSEEDTIITEENKTE